MYELERIVYTQETPGLGCRRCRESLDVVHIGSFLLFVLREKLVDWLQAGLDHRTVRNARLFDELIVHL